MLIIITICLTIERDIIIRDQSRRQIRALEQAEQNIRIDQDQLRGRMIPPQFRRRSRL